jgi:hypothetical protein
MVLRMPGFRVRIMPKDLDKSRVWLLILEWYHHFTWGVKTIAVELNELGIPSPDAGRWRKGRAGHRYRVSGKWSGRTVLTLIRNRAIIGMNVYGAQSKGKHRRLGASGPRVLLPSDRREKKPVDREPAVVADYPPHGL